MTASAGPALKELHRNFGNQIEFVTLYVREAHPGECYPQPESFEQKLQFARDYQQRDGIAWTVAVDELNGALHHELDLKPNSAYLVGSDGRVAQRVLWSNDTAALREGLEAVANGRIPAHPDRQGMLLPMLRGMGEMYDVLSQSGRVAQRDFRREMPPVYGLAWLAHFFRPLPALGRGLAAGATATAALGALALLGWSLARRASQ